MKIKTANLSLLIFSIFLPQVIGFLGAIITLPAITSWYLTLIKPPLTPPGWIFGPVWTLLYFLIGISLYLILKMKKNGLFKQPALTFYIQLFLNLMWSIVFFGFQSPGGGLIVIILLWIAIFMTILKFMKISKIASQLLVPYLLWVTFATYLNFSFFLLNR